MLPRRARCVLSRLRCNGHSLLLGSYLSRIGRIENPFCSACGHSSQDISHLILHCPATDSAPLTLWRLSISVRPLVQTLGSCPASGAPWSSAMPPSLGRGRVHNNNNNKTLKSRVSHLQSTAETKSTNLFDSRQGLKSQIFSPAPSVDIWYKTHVFLMFLQGLKLVNFESYTIN